MLKIGCTPTEGLAALFAFVGLLSSVDPLMLSQGRVGTQTFATLLTFIGPFSDMILLMYNTIIAGLESFATFLTFEGLFPSVAHLMPNELWVVPEDFPTFFALIELHSPSKYQIWIQIESRPRGVGLAFKIKVLRHISEESASQHSGPLCFSRSFLFHSWLFTLDPWLTT